METFTMIWNVSWDSHRMKLCLVKHVTRRISLIEKGQRKNGENYTYYLGILERKP
jgi:hypothetical protein